MQLNVDENNAPINSHLTPPMAVVVHPAKLGAPKHTHPHTHTCGQNLPPEWIAVSVSVVSLVNT